MNKNRRHRGRQLRRIARLHRSWEATGRQEGPVENQLCMYLGRAYRAGITEREMNKVRR